MGDLIREANGKIVITSPSGREVFNTNTPMPARIGQLETSQNLSFSRVPGEFAKGEIKGSTFSGFHIEWRRYLPAHERTTNHVLGPVPEGTDFWLVNFRVNSISRTRSQHNNPRSPYNGGPSWYMANGSVLLESLPHGSMHRAMHFVVENGQMICQLQQTNLHYDSGFEKASHNVAESHYNMTFKIDYGKFIDGAV